MDREADVLRFMGLQSQTRLSTKLMTEKPEMASLIHNDFGQQLPHS